jgi:hypothetical protein
MNTDWTDFDGFRQELTLIYTVLARQDNRMKGIFFLATEGTENSEDRRIGDRDA